MVFSNSSSHLASHTLCFLLRYVGKQVSETMGSKSSKPPSSHSAASFRDRVEEEIARRMMIQREVQMAVNIARARDTLNYFGTAWAVFICGVRL